MTSPIVSHIYLMCSKHSSWRNSSRKFSLLKVSTLIKGRSGLLFLQEKSTSKPGRRGTSRRSTIYDVVWSVAQGMHTESLHQYTFICQKILTFSISPKMCHSKLKPKRLNGWIMPSKNIALNYYLSHGIKIVWLVVQISIEKIELVARPIRTLLAGFFWYLSRTFQCRFLLSNYFDILKMQIFIPWSVPFWWPAAIKKPSWF